MCAWLPRTPPAAPPSVFFDEAHGEAWTIRPEVARADAARAPRRLVLARAAELARARDFDVVAHVDGPLDAAVAGGRRRPRHRAPVRGAMGAHRRRLAGLHRRGARRDRGAASAAGGGLIVLGETEQDKYGTNLGELLARFGDRRRARHGPGLRAATTAAELGPRPSSAAGAAAPRATCWPASTGAAFYRAGTVSAGDGPGARAHVADGLDAGRAAGCRASSTAPGASSCSPTPTSSATTASTTSTTASCGSNLVYWAAGPAFAAPAPHDGLDRSRRDPAWPALREATDALRLLQEPDGSVAGRAPRRPRARTSTAMIAAVGALAPLVPHQADYLAAVVEDLRPGPTAASRKPDFTRSLELFRPDRAAPRRHRAPRRLPDVHAEPARATRASRR